MGPRRPPSIAAFIDRCASEVPQITLRLLGGIHDMRLVVELRASSGFPPYFRFPVVSLQALQGVLHRLPWEAGPKNPSLGGALQLRPSLQWPCVGKAPSQQ